MRQWSFPLLFQSVWILSKYLNLMSLNSNTRSWTPAWAKGLRSRFMKSNLEMTKLNFTSLVTSERIPIRERIKSFSRPKSTWKMMVFSFGETWYQILGTRCSPISLLWSSSDMRYSLSLWDQLRSTVSYSEQPRDSILPTKKYKMRKHLFCWNLPKDNNVKKITNLLIKTKNQQTAEKLRHLNLT